MSDENYTQKLRKEFLNQIELKLPFWLKYEEAELKQVLKELEEHIEDKVEELEASGKSNLEATQIAISQMGSPTQIANEYKRRGTPKFYISEGLFPTYLTVLKYAAIAIGLIVAIFTMLGTIIAGLSGGDWLSAIGNGFLNLFIWGTVAVCGISVFFVWLSYEGYFPDDLKNLFKSKEKREAEKRQPPKPKKELPAGKKQKEDLYKKIGEKPSNMFVGGITTLVFGILAVWQPFTILNVLIDPYFLLLLMIVGIFWIILGILHIIQGFFVTALIYEGTRALIPVRAIINLLTIPILIALLLNPQIFPVIWWTESTGLQVTQIADSFLWIFYLVLSIIIVALIGTACYNFYRTVRLNEEDFWISEA
jgi:hypothetical protein